MLRPRALASAFVFVAALSGAGPAAAATAQQAPPVAPAPPPALEAALATAKAEHKPLVLQFSTSWCGPCKDFDARIFPAPTIQKLLPTVVYVHYDAEMDAGIPAAAKYAIDSYPTFLLVDEEGRVRARTTGTPKAETFAAWLADAPTAVLDEASLVRRVLATPNDPHLLLLGGRWFEEQGRLAEAIALYERASRHPGADGAMGEVRGAELRRLVNRQAAVVADARALVAHHLEAPSLPEALQLARVAHAMTHEQIVLALRTAAQRAPAEAQNRLAYVALEENELALAKTLVETALAAEPKNANYLDTLAEVLAHMGNRDGAVATADRAIAEAPGPYFVQAFKANRARFAKGEPLVRAPLSLADAVDAFDPPRRPRSRGAMSPFVVFLMERNAAFRKVGAACKPYAGKLTEAWVRVERTGPSGPPSRVTILEPNLAPALEHCLKRELAAASWPSTPPDEAPLRATESVDF